VRVIIRADASPEIGGGHMMRCLALADALARRGARCTFIAAWSLPGLETEIEARGHALRRIEPPGEPPSGRGWEGFQLGSGAQRRDAARTLEAIAMEVLDWVVIDHYWLGPAWESELRRRGARVLAIDDLADRGHDCDLLLDQTVGRSPGDYRSLVPATASIFAGARFALLRPEFARDRPQALQRRRTRGPVRRLLLSLGLSDVGGDSERVLRAVLDLTPPCAIDVVLGADAPSRAAVEALAGENPQGDIACRQSTDG